jgi:phosphoribosylamine--glycine ligase
MRYFVIGSGGREHALAWRLTTDGSSREVYVAPGNGGIDDRWRVPLKVDDFDGIVRFCREKEIGTVIVGPEAPLVDGIVDYLEKEKIPTFGPSAAAARLEGSKMFAKKVMENCGVATARYREFSGPVELLKFIESADSYPLVIKLDGLAAGKGVGIPENREEARLFIEDNVREDTKVFVEDFIQGEEVSVLGISDGRTVLPCIPAQDHKRALEGDLGPNTGGMGAYAPTPVLDEEGIRQVHRDILQPVVDGMREEGMPFQGVLYAGLIVNSQGVFVLEFNVRFGDPEAQVVLPLMEEKLGDVIQASIHGSLDKQSLSFSQLHAMTVVMASGGYPGSYEKGKIIQGLDSMDEDITVFHAGTDRRDGRVVSSGGRVLNVTATGESLADARDRVYAGIEKISFEGAFFRKDIGHRALS